MNSTEVNTQPAEYELISKIASGQKNLFEQLIRQNNPYLYKIGRTYGFSHEDVEDLMQETYINAYINLPKFEGRAKFRTWLVKIMISQCYHKAQKLNLKNVLPLDELKYENEMPLYTQKTDAATDKAVINKELLHVIEEAVTKLPVQYSMVFTLREMNGFNVAETAEAMQLSEANVKVRLTRAKEMLRREIEKRYSAEDIFEFNLVYCDKMVDKVMQRINAL